jgi:intracellular multiplication protein IcmL
MESRAYGSDETMESIGFYRDLAKKSHKIIMMLSGALAILAIICLVQVFVWIQPKPVYFGMTESMELLPMTPMDEPLMNDAALKAWLAAAITDCFNMDFINWRERLSNARQYFSKDAFTGYATALDSEGHIELLTQHRAIMHSVPAGTPVLTKAGVIRGVLTWEFEVPLLLNYETSTQRLSTQRIVAVCRVQRMPTTNYVRGVAITQLVTVMAPH